MKSKATSGLIAKLKQVDIVFVIDSTGSMASQIAEVKSRLAEFARKLKASSIHPSVSYSVVAYRDHPPEDSSFVVHPVPLSDDIERIVKDLQSLSAEGGGDGPEAVLDGLDYALGKTKWRQHSHKVILLTGDAPPHGMATRYGGKTDSHDRWPKGCPCGLTIEAVTSLADKKGVIIYSVGVGGWDLMISSFTDIAEATGGEFVPLSQVDSLIDKILPVLERELAKVSDDIDTATWLSDGRSLSDLIHVGGKSTSEVRESVERLKKKGVTISPDVDEELEAIASGTSSVVRKPRIKLGDSPTKGISTPEEKGRIKLK